MPVQLEELVTHAAPERAFALTHCPGCPYARAMASSTLESSLGPGDEASYLALAPGPAFVADLEGRVKAVNAEWERVLGFSQDELRGRPFAELLHPDDRPALEGVGSALRRGETVRMSDGRFLRKEGPPLRFVWSASPRLDRGLIVGSAHDVTELYDRLRRFETPAHGTKDVVGVRDDAGEPEAVTAITRPMDRA